MADSRTQEILDEERYSTPQEIGYDRRLSGRAAVSLTNPIPRIRTVKSFVPPLKATSSFDQVLTRSSIPVVTPSRIEEGRVLTTVEQVPGISAIPPPYVCPPQQVDTVELERKIRKRLLQEMEAERQSKETPEDTSTGNPKDYTDQEMNELLFEALISEGPEISCSCSGSDYYSTSNPSEGEYKWKSDISVVYRLESNSDRNEEASREEWITSKDLFVKYSRWGPSSNSSSSKTSNSETSSRPTTKLLLLHDAVDTRKSWWCTQKILSSFVDTVSVDLLGSGDSLLPRSTKIPDGKKLVASEFPWSFTAHAKYLIDMAKILWPGEKFYVAGCGWGAQIAASMASLTTKLAGFIMLSPLGFSRTSLSESFSPYSELYDLKSLTADEDLVALGSVFISKINRILTSNFGQKSAASSNLTTIKLILNSYSNFDRRRILIDQLVALDETPLQEFPATSENRTGLQIQNIRPPCLVISGEYDSFYPVEHRHLYPAIYYHSSVSSILLPKTGHFIYLEKSLELAQHILNFISSNDGFSALASPYIGFMESSQGNERALISSLSSVYL